MLEFSLLSQVLVVLFAASTLVQLADIQSFTESIIESLSQFAATVAQVTPKIVPALVLLGIGLLVDRVIS
ncbi:MAG: hypothetical protein M3275_08215 [Thermoproteota archaeon]|nr:hypothetical protein [Thermoproteota archaeon]